MKHIKDYLKQIKLEVKKLFFSKFMMILIGLMLVVSIAVPIISTTDWFQPRNYYGYTEGEFEIDGVTIDDDNIMYWDIYQATESLERIQNEASTEIDDLSIEYVQIMLDEFLLISQHVKSYSDYRSNIMWSSREHISSKFILEHMDEVSSEDMQMALEQTYMFHFDTMTIKEEYYDLTQEKRQEKLKLSTEALELSHKIIIEGDHQAYFDYMLVENESRINNCEINIANLEQSIINNPENEDMFNQQIEENEMQIEMIKEITLPILDYRMEHDVVPGEDDWRDTALNAKEGSLRQIRYNSDILTQEEYEEHDYLKWEHESYAKYKEALQKRVDEATDNLQIAEKSLDSGKPDMAYVKDGTRAKVSGFMYFSLLIAVFGVIIGGGLIAREFQQGTVRLLLIRPKSRTKIVLSKLFALVLICLAVYVGCVLVNLITNGFIYGFKDLGYPNYTISSGPNGISFFIYLVPKLLACFVTVVFGISMSYFLSILTRNAALSVSIPLVCFAASLIIVPLVAYRPNYDWIVYTPIPYINMPMVFNNDMYSAYTFEPIASLGMVMLAVMSVIAVVAGTWIMRKRDITN